MEISSLKEWIDNGFILHNKNNSGYTITIRRQADNNYRFFYGVTIENSYRIIEKKWITFLEKIDNFLEENRIEF